MDSSKYHTLHVDGVWLWPLPRRDGVAPGGHLLVVPGSVGTSRWKWALRIRPLPGYPTVRNKLAGESASYGGGWQAYYDSKSSLM